MKTSWIWMGAPFVAGCMLVAYLDGRVVEKRRGTSSRHDPGRATLAAAASAVRDQTSHPANGNATLGEEDLAALSEDRRVAIERALADLLERLERLDRLEAPPGGAETPLPDPSQGRGAVSARKADEAARWLAELKRQTAPGEAELRILTEVSRILVYRDIVEPQSTGVLRLYPFSAEERRAYERARQELTASLAEIEFRHARRCWTGPLQDGQGILYELTPLTATEREEGAALAAALGQDSEMNALTRRLFRSFARVELGRLQMAPATVSGLCFEITEREPTVRVQRRDGLATVAGLIRQLAADQGRQVRWSSTTAFTTTDQRSGWRYERFLAEEHERVAGP